MVKSTGGSRIIRLRSLFVVMALAGLWHGAAWHFVLWGLFFGVLLVAHTLAIPYLWSMTSGLGRTASIGFKVLSWFVTFHLLIISFVLFRAQTVADIGIALRKMFLDFPGDLRTAGLSFLPNAEPTELLFYAVLIAGTLLTQFISFDERFKWTANPVFRGARGALTLVLIAVLYPTVKEQFIYFQF
jgi:alginate O-acetyltransferase complex protein AlgI